MSTGPDQVTEQVLARARVRDARRRAARAAQPNPLVIVGVAFVAGIVLAKLLDPRGHG